MPSMVTAIIAAGETEQLITMLAMLYSECSHVSKLLRTESQKHVAYDHYNYMETRFK